MMAKMIKAKDNCKSARIASMAYEYKSSGDQLTWNIAELSQMPYPVVPDFLSSKRL